MKNLLRYLVIIFIAGTSGFSQTDELTILYLGDTHSCLAPLAPRNADLSGTQGGIARAASIIGYYENSGQNVLTLHSGDFSIGDLFYNKYFGSPELQILKNLGVDAMAVGNHEFDLTPDALYGALNDAFGLPNTGFPLLSANSNLSGYSALDPYIDDYTIKEFGDLKVGIFGLTTHSTMMLSSPAPVVISDLFLEKAGEMVGILTAAGCDFIICLSHYGYTADQAIASYVPGIDLIIGGHDHLLINPLQINETWLVQAESFYKKIGRITFDISDGSVVMTANEMIELNENVPEEPTVKSTVDFLISGIESVYGPVYTQQIGTSQTFIDESVSDVNKPGNHTSAAGNFISDAMRWKTGTDIALEPGGSISQPIYKGPVVAADLFRTVGYGFNTDNALGFRIVTFTISGLELYKAIETVLTFLNDDEFLPQFSGLVLKYVPDAPEGSRVSSIYINKQQLNPLQMYTVTSNELVPMILDQFEIEYSGLSVMTGYSEFQLLADYMNEIGNKITPVKDARVIAVKNSGNIHKDSDDKLFPSEYELGQNYPNPFNPVTSISFSLPEDTEVKLAVYNLLGEEIDILINDLLGAGKYSVTWNAAGNPAGVYLYTIQNNRFSSTKKMILMK